MKCAALAFIMVCGCVAAQDITIVPSPNHTSAETGLEFTLDGVSKDKSGRSIVMGTIRNTGDKTYGLVAVAFTVRDSDGAFITRFETHSSPREIGPGEVGYVKRRLRIDRDAPVVLEYSLTGRLRETASIAERRDKSRIAANTHNAVAALKSYAVAQVVYKKMGNPEYAGDYRKLHSDVMMGQKLMLLSENFANARIGDGCVAFKGYLFLEDPAVTDWKQGFALYAYPEKYGVSGEAVLWMGSNGMVKTKDLALPMGSPPVPFAANESPLNQPEAWKDWSY